MDTLEITTETRTLETLEQAAEALKETDSGMIREWLKGLVPEVLGFALQILFAVVLYVIGSRVIRLARKFLAVGHSVQDFLDALCQKVWFGFFCLFIFCILFW